MCHFKEEEAWDISKQLEMARETIQLLREDLIKAKVHTVHSLPTVRHLELWLAQCSLPVQNRELTSGFLLLLSQLCFWWWEWAMAPAEWISVLATEIVVAALFCLAQE